MAISEATWDEAVALLSGARRVGLACHVDPDGDALGSMLALHHTLRGRGVDTAVSWGSLPGRGRPADSALAVPPQYTFLPGVDDLVPAGQFPAAPDVLVAFDTASPERLGTLRPVVDAAGAVIVIDHHPSGMEFGDVQLCDGDAAATAVLVEELIRRLGSPMDEKTATCLYVGVITDTARFQNPNTTPAVMGLAGRLLATGIDPAAISRQVWETKSFGYLKVLGRAMDRAQLIPEAGLAWTVVYQSDLADLGITMAETEGMIDVLRSVEAAECALVCKEQPDGSWNASLRSKGRIDVGVLAASFRGGGHKFAAGFRAEGDLEDVLERVSATLAAIDAAQGDSPASRRAAKPVKAGR